MHPDDQKSPRPANRLARASSPYLIQHQYNPVDWYEWGDAAFERARREDKPVFLSIGYATCHWCHVMAHESFEDETVAALLNDHCISIKVDREERPDIDHVYMAVCQMLSPHCGWPLTVLMTPDRQPFFVATYLPRESTPGRPGMRELIPAVASYWRERRAELLENARQIVEGLQQRVGAPGREIDRADCDAAFHELREAYDHRHGGFGHRPKFPAPHNLLFLLRYADSFGAHPAREMVNETLRQMRRGGIYDQIGFGLHRYSTDERWFLPHFEKMLYDQAMLILSAAEAAHASGADDLAGIARETVAYVRRDLADPDGGFYSGEDADSEGEEGKFYVWRAAEIDALLPPADAALWRRVFGITEEGTYREEASGRPTGANIPYLTRPPEEFAAAEGRSLPELQAKLESIRAVLLQARNRRPRPLRDDKVLTDWNGLMIAALARAGLLLGEPEWQTAAARAAEFVLKTLRRPDGRLLHRWRSGEAGITAFADDYAFFAWGLLELYRGDFDTRWLAEALACAQILWDDFADAEGGGLWFSAADGEPLPARTKEGYDGAIPSANAVAADVFVRLARLTGDPVWEKRARGIGAALADLVKRAPGACTHLLASSLPLIVGGVEVVIVGDPAAADTRALIDTISRQQQFFITLLVKPAGEAGTAVAELAPFTRALVMTGERATAFLCRNHTCGLPITETAALAAALKEQP